MGNSFPVAERLRKPCLRYVCFQVTLSRNHCGRHWPRAVQSAIVANGKVSFVDPLHAEVFHLPGLEVADDLVSKHL